MCQERKCLKRGNVNNYNDDNMREKNKLSSVSAFILTIPFFMQCFASSTDRLRMRPVDDPDAQRNQPQCRAGYPAERLTVLVQKKRRKQHAHNRVDKAQDADPADRIVFQKYAPQGVSDRGDQSHIKKQKRRGGGEAGETSACQGTRGGQHKTSDHELEAAQDEGVFPLRELFDEGGRKRIHKRGEKDKSFAVPVHRKINRIARDLDEKDARETDEAADDLSPGQLLKSEDECGNQDREKCGRGLDDRRFYPGCVRHPDVEEIVLADRLEEREYEDIPDASAAREEDAPPLDASEQQHEETGEREADAGEEQQRSGIAGSDVEETVPDFHAGEGAAPQEAADQSHQEDDGVSGPEPIFFHECSPSKNSIKLRPILSQSIRGDVNKN